MRQVPAHRGLLSPPSRCVCLALLCLEKTLQMRQRRWHWPQQRRLQHCFCVLLVLRVSVYLIRVSHLTVWLAPKKGAGARPAVCSAGGARAVGCAWRGGGGGRAAQREPVALTPEPTNCAFVSARARAHFGDVGALAGYSGSFMRVSLSHGSICDVTCSHMLVSCWRTSRGELVFSSPITGFQSQTKCWRSNDLS